MTFTTKTYEQDFIHAQICSFEGKGGVTEYHIMFSVTDPSLSFGEQLDSLQRAYDAVTKKEAGNAVQQKNGTESGILQPGASGIEEKMSGAWISDLK